MGTAGMGSRTTRQTWTSSTTCSADTADGLDGLTGLSGVLRITLLWRGVWFWTVVRDGRRRAVPRTSTAAAFETALFACAVYVPCCVYALRVGYSSRARMRRA